MYKRIFICAAIIFAFGVIGYLLYTNYEIVPSKIPFLPSHEVRQNSYYALERWLIDTGHSPHVQSFFYPEALERIEEKTVVVLSTAANWRDADIYLIPWIEKGKSLVINLTNINTYDNDVSTENDLLKFILGLGISVGTTPNYYTYTDDSSPSFHWRVKFIIEDDKEYFTINDIHGNVRLVEIPIGEGTLTLIGQPIFLENQNIKKEPNARLAWRLTGARSSEDNMDILFVRYTGDNFSKPLLGTLIQRGNLLPVIIGALLLIIFGFWMVIPVFGLVSEEKQRTSRPIKERFTAEISFLKKYKGLYYYLRDTEQNSNYSYNDIINKIRSEYDETNKSKC